MDLNKAIHVFIHTALYYKSFISCICITHKKIGILDLQLAGNQPLLFQPRP